MTNPSYISHHYPCTYQIRQSGFFIPLLPHSYLIEITNPSLPLYIQIGTIRFDLHPHYQIFTLQLILHTYRIITLAHTNWGTLGEVSL